MDNSHSDRLLGGMFLKQAQLLRDEGHVKEAKDLLIRALSVLLFAGALSETTPVPVLDLRRGASQK